jgi:hypothetical protein
MASRVHWVAGQSLDGAGRGRRRLASGFVTLASAGVLVVGFTIVLRSAPIRQTHLFTGVGAGVQDASPAQLVESAAAALEAAMRAGASGISFEIVQRQTIHARAEGPLIDIPDPSDPGKSLGTTDHYEIGTLLERGSATADGFSMEILAGPLPGRLFDYDADKAEIRRRALVRDGVAWRDDGTGWYETDELPGIGFDPATVRSLPRLLRAATDATDRAVAPPPDGLGNIPGLRGSATTPVRALGASARVADIPAVIAADGAAFSEITGPADYRFDDAGRLVGLTVISRNTNMTTYDLIIETVYAISYPDRPPKVPDPVPTMAPNPSSRVEG